MFYGEDVLIGARMGQSSKLFACDFDLYKPGAKDYMEELADAGLLVDTQVHLTRNGGLHFIYRSDTEYPNCKPHEGVEIKGEGGYIIVPPSPGYVVQNTGIAYAPPGLVQKLLEARKAASKSSVDALKSAILAAKDFHDSLAMLAARRAAQGWSQAKAQAEAFEALSASVAQNPQHPRHDRWAKLMRDEGGEFSRMFSSANQKYNPTAFSEKLKENVTDDMMAGLAAATAGFFSRGPAQNDEGAAHSGGLEEELKKLGVEQGEDELPRVGDWPFQKDGYFSLDDREILDQRYVMYPLFAERETVLFAAEPKAGKTAISLKFAMNIASGTSIGSGENGLSITEPRPVLYFTLEGARAVELRLVAERKQMVQDGLALPDTDRLFVVDRPHNFLEDAQQVKTCAKIVAHDLKCQEVFGTALGVVFIDTLTKAMPGGDQNSVEDTSKLFKLVDILRENGVTATIVFIHHLSKQGEVRGSTNIEAEVDVVCSVEKAKQQQGVLRLVIRRARSIDESVSYGFRLKSFYLGETVQGHKVHAPVVEFIEGQDMTKTGEAAKEASEWATLCSNLIKTLGVGKSDTMTVFEALVSMGLVERPKSRRPSPDSDMIQKPLKRVFGNRFNWSFGEYWFAVTKLSDDTITGLEIRDTR